MTGFTLLNFLKPVDLRIAFAILREVPGAGREIL